MFATAKARRWGDSLAVVIPRKIVKEQNLAPNDELEMTLRRKQTVADFFGIVNPKATPQGMKDEARKGWR